MFNLKVSDEDVTKLIEATIKIQRVWRRFIVFTSKGFKNMIEHFFELIKDILICKSQNTIRTW